jgi:recombination protein RecA
VGFASGVLSKTGAWFNYGDTRLGQGRENARDFLKANPSLADTIEDEIRGRLAAIVVGPDGPLPEAESETV